MAVARIIAPPSWHEAVADGVQDVPALRRELLRAANRPGVTAELRADEVYLLRDRFPDDGLVLLAVASVELSEERDRNRPRPGNEIQRRLISSRANSERTTTTEDCMSTAVRTSRRTAEEWQELARELLPELQSGKRISEFSDLVGSNVSALRVALAQLGYDAHGEPLKLQTVSGRQPRVLAKRVAARRRAGAPWWQVVAETGKSYGELTGLLAEHGYSTSGEDRTNGA